MAAAPLAAFAQTSFSVSALSDLRMRGLSYSDGKPVAQFSLNHDFASGLYAGAMLSKARAQPSRLDGVGSVYLGFARTERDFHWDAGVVRNLYGGTRQYNYHEWYAGIGVERLSARLSYSPSYQGLGGRSAYAELNGSVPLGDDFDASVHLGYLKTFGSAPSWYTARMDRPDWRLGLNGFAGDWSFQLAWSGTRKAGVTFPGWRYGATRGLVIGATRHF